MYRTFLCSLLTLVVSLSITNCAFHNPPHQLRVINQSTVPLEQVVVIFPQERLTFGPLPVGGTSDYQTVAQGVYGYAAYEVTVNGQVIEQPVIDWVGEQPLKGRHFTYELTVDPQGTALLPVSTTIQRP